MNYSTSSQQVAKEHAFTLRLTQIRGGKVRKGRSEIDFKLIKITKYSGIIALFALSYMCLGKQLHVG